MSVNTHKSWHIHREINKEKVRRLQDELSAAKDRSAKDLETILNGESVTINELLEQVYKLGEPPLPEPITSADVNFPGPTVTIPLNDELSRFDPLVYPIEPDVPTEESLIRRPHQGRTVAGRLSNVSDDQSVPSTTASKSVHQEEHRMQGDTRKKFYGSTLSFSRNFRRCRKGDSAHPMSYNVHATKHATATHRDLSKETRSWPVTRISSQGQPEK
ncbi:Hypothetical protein GLP15_5047 [Giardia lamblia P15]|uniref:Uncharacterized protein n=1 Tax=Giardia intestinalis (strain P15) TaxID=658858 RepID=E1EZJ7_GIAIA|nr:Hypothetical protein GLP15_5047 [Giardia lamblia P15]